MEAIDIEIIEKINTLNRIKTRAKAEFKSNAGTAQLLVILNGTIDDLEFMLTHARYIDFKNRIMGHVEVFITSANLLMENTKKDKP